MQPGPKQRHPRGGDPIPKGQEPWSSGLWQPLRWPDTFPAPSGTPPRECILGSVRSEACRTLMTEIKSETSYACGCPGSPRLTGGSALTELPAADGWTPDRGDLQFTGYLVELVSAT